MLVEVEAGWRCGDRPEGEIAYKILCGSHADRGAHARYWVDRVDALQIGGTPEDHAVGTHGEAVIEVGGRYTSQDFSVSRIKG